jgi:hypothetical protein
MVKTHRASIGRLTDRRLLGPTIDSDDSNLSPVVVEEVGLRGRSPRHDDGISLTKVGRVCQASSAEGL